MPVPTAIAGGRTYFYFMTRFASLPRIDTALVSPYFWQASQNAIASVSLPV